MSINYDMISWAVITNTPGTAGTSFVVSTGTGSRFPNGAQTTYAVAYSTSDPGQNELVKITNRSTDTLTVARNQDARGAVNAAPGLALMVIDGLGPWVPVTFSAGNFTSDTGSWTVASGDVDNFAYRLIGKTMIVNFVLNTTTVGGTPNVLRIAVPASQTIARGTYNAVAVLLDNSSRVSGYIEALSGATVIGIHRQDAANFATATDTTYVYGEITFEVQ